MVKLRSGSHSQSDNPARSNASTVQCARANQQHEFELCAGHVNNLMFLLRFCYPDDGKKKRKELLYTYKDETEILSPLLVRKTIISHTNAHFYEYIRIIRSTTYQIGSTPVFCTHLCGTLSGENSLYYICSVFMAIAFETYNIFQQFASTSASASSNANVSVLTESTGHNLPI